MAIQKVKELLESQNIRSMVFREDILIAEEKLSRVEDVMYSMSWLHQEYDVTITPALYDTCYIRIKRNNKILREMPAVTYFFEDGKEITVTKADRVFVVEAGDSEVYFGTDAFKKHYPNHAASIWRPEP